MKRVPEDMSDELSRMADSLGKALSTPELKEHTAGPSQFGRQHRRQVELDSPEQLG